MASRSRRAQQSRRGHRSTTRRDSIEPGPSWDDTTARTTSRLELGIYGVLAGMVAAVVLVVAGRSWWVAAAVLVGSAALVFIVAVTVGSESSRDPGRGRRRKR